MSKLDAAEIKRRVEVFIASGRSRAAAARLLNISPPTLGNTLDQAERLGLLPPPDPVEDTHERDIETHAERRSAAKLADKYQAAIDEIARLRAERDAFAAVSASAARIAPIEPTQGTKTSEAVAVTVASDWHVEEIVNPRTVGGRNKYSPEIAKARAETYFRRVVRMTDKERQDVAIDTLVIVLAGDFISGNIHEELLETCAMPPVAAAIYAAELLANGLAFLLEHGKFKRIVAVTCCGNHSRITKKVHYATEAGNALETSIYSTLARRFNDIDWISEPSYLTHFKIFQRTIRVHHGHAVRSLGGVGGIYPALLRAEYKWNLWQPADLSICGHHHTYTWHHRAACVNGSLIGAGPAAMAWKCEPEPPMQAFFLLDKKRGVTVMIPIMVES